MENILLTGAAGFIGFHVAQILLKEGTNVIGIDNLNSYYDVQLKKDRLKQLERYPNFKFLEIDIIHTTALSTLFKKNKITKVIHLAAQAGVRFSIDQPDAYIQSNIVGFANILEMCRHHEIEHLVFASSSSVYGTNARIPFHTSDNTDKPVSLYAATKKSNEILAYSYSHLFKIPITGLRFFTVYGPWGRPDMAYFSFTKKIMSSQPIQLFNNGNMLRDFTYIDDVIFGIKKVIDLIPNQSDVPNTIYNIGHNKPEYLKDFIIILQDLIGKKAIIESLPMQMGDVTQTYADISELQKYTGFNPTTSLREGLGKFIEWYKSYYQ